MKLQLSLWYGTPPSQLGKHMTARDMLEYEAANALGMIPDWQEIRELLIAGAGGEVSGGGAEQQDMTTLYGKRKALYGRQGR